MVRLLPSLRSSSHGLWLLVIGYCLNGGDCKMVAMLIYCCLSKGLQREQGVNGRHTSLLAIFSSTYLTSSRFTGRVILY
jgi:hypothetical protein